MIKLICVGKIKEKYLTDGVNDYFKRINKYHKFEIIEVDTTNNFLSRLYDLFMMITIVISIIPLAFVKQQQWMIFIDRITVIIFIIDYLLRWFVADISTNKKISFITYPFKPYALIDLFSILPSVTALNNRITELNVSDLNKEFKRLSF